MQNGTAKKLGELVQASCTGIGGLAVGFYFSWQLTLVVLGGVPLLAGAMAMLIRVRTHSSLV
jgi:ATP-binding cassette subfamily B (MDR/TAP) protein 1